MGKPAEELENYGQSQTSEEKKDASVPAVETPAEAPAESGGGVSNG